MLLATAAALAAPRQQHASPLSPGAAQHALEKVYIPPWFDRMLLEKFNATGALPARLLGALHEVQARRAGTRPRDLALCGA